MLATDGLPLPPRNLCPTTNPDIQQYLDSGMMHFKVMRAMLEAEHFKLDGIKVLDFGMGIGRTLRIWKDEPIDAIYGVDINQAQVEWCRDFLRHPKFHFALSTRPLPLESEMFDLVYAGSVFTHIDTDITDWLSEMHRVLKPGGFFYATIHDEHTWQLARDGKAPILGKYVKDAAVLPQPFVSFGQGHRSQVFFERNYFRQLADAFFTCRDYQLEARGYQTGFLFRK